MSERGIVVGGDVVPGTEGVRRDDAFWWSPGHHSTRSRLGTVVNLYVQHWTAGHTSHDADAGPATYRAMLARKSKKRPGQPLDVGVNFVVGWGGTIWQVADVLTACVHVGDRPVIRRSVSTEHRWPGDRKWATKIGYKGPWQTVTLNGRPFEVLAPSAEMLEASRWLAEALASIDHPEVKIPRVVPASNARFTRVQMRQFRGAAEHGQMPGSTKVDCAGLLNAELARAGWATGDGE